MIRSRQMMRTLRRQMLALLLSLGALSAADLSGLWMGQVPGRFGKVDDISFQFKVSGATLTGKLFGDEFDLLIENGVAEGDKISFIVTSTNYYNREKVRTRYSGVAIGDEIELNRERVLSSAEKAARASRPDAKVEAPIKPFRIKRLTGPTARQAR